MNSSEITKKAKEMLGDENGDVDVTKLVTEYEELTKEYSSKGYTRIFDEMNVKSTQIALSAFNKPTILILGGLDRGHSFDGLTEYMKNVKLVVCYGQTKKRLKDYCDKINIKCIVKDNLKEAVVESYNNAQKGYVVLLSPACASWDQYNSFEERGCEFKSSVKELE